MLKLGGQTQRAGDCSRWRGRPTPFLIDAWDDFQEWAFPTLCNRTEKVAPFSETVSCLNLSSFKQRGEHKRLVACIVLFKAVPIDRCRGPANWDERWTQDIAHVTHM